MNGLRVFAQIAQVFLVLFSPIDSSSVHRNVWNKLRKNRRQHPFAGPSCDSPPSGEDKEREDIRRGPHRPQGLQRDRARARDRAHELIRQRHKRQRGPRAELGQGKRPGFLARDQHSWDRRGERSPRRQRLRTLVRAFGRDEKCPQGREEAWLGPDGPDQHGPFPGRFFQLVPSFVVCVQRRRGSVHETAFGVFEGSRIPVLLERLPVPRVHVQPGEYRHKLRSLRGDSRDL